MSYATISYWLSLIIIWVSKLTLHLFTGFSAAMRFTQLAGQLRPKLPIEFFSQDKHMVAYHLLRCSLLHCRFRRYSVSPHFRLPFCSFTAFRFRGMAVLAALIFRAARLPTARSCRAALINKHTSCYAQMIYRHFHFLSIFRCLIDVSIISVATRVYRLISDSIQRPQRVSSFVESLHWKWAVAATAWLHFVRFKIVWCRDIITGDFISFFFHFGVDYYCVNVINTIHFH